MLWPFVVLLGACVGSFVNVVVYRLPRHLSLWHPPSHCRFWAGCGCGVGVVIVGRALAGVIP